MPRTMYAACSAWPGASRRISPRPRCAAKRVCPSTALSWWRSPRPRCRGPLLLPGDRSRALKPPAGAVYALVRQPRLDAPRASIGAVGQGAGRALGAADRADWRRQDAGGILAELGGTEWSSVSFLAACASGSLPPCGGGWG